MQEEIPKLIIFFIKEKKRYFFFIRILNKVYPTKDSKLEIDISQEFINSKEKKIIDLELVQNTSLEGGIKFKMNLFYGTNKAYCFLNKNDYEILVEYNFIEYEGIFYKQKELNEHDGNGLVNRLVLINAPLAINIKNEVIGFLFEVGNLYKDGINSFEICDCNYLDRNFAKKVIQEEKEKNNFVSKIKEQEEKLSKIYDDIKKLVQLNTQNKEIFDIIFSKYEINELDINFCQPKNKLKEEFKTKEDFYLVYLYFIWYSINFHKERNSQISLIDLFNEIDNIYNLYLKDNDLLIYEKVMLFCSHIFFFLEKNDLIKYKSANLKYMKKTKDIEDKSIYGLSFKFIKNFISKLNEKSYLFFPLLMLNSGTYYFNRDSSNIMIYGYNRESCDILKSHLEDLIPDVFFEYEDEGNELFKEYGFSFKGYNIIFLNRYILFKNFQKDPSKSTYQNKEEEYLFKYYSIRVSKTIMNESFRSNIINYNKNKRISSSLKFFNKNKNLVEIRMKTYEVNNKNEEYFKTLKTENGNILEYFFGEYGAKLIVDLIYEIDNIGKLYDNIDYFVNDNLTQLQKYIINKYKIYNYKLNYQESDISLEKENELMSGFIEEYEKKLCTSVIPRNIDKKNLVQKQNDVFYEHVKDEESKLKGYDFYRKKLFEEKNYKERDKYFAPFFNTLHTPCN